MDNYLINPKVLKWAREKNNYTVSQAAKKCGVIVATYTSWEDGTKEIPASKLPTLSKVFRYTSALFLLNDLPNERYPIEFRNYFVEFGISQSRELGLAIRSALSIQDKLNDLIELNDNEFLTKITKLKNKSPEEIAEGLTFLLGVNTHILSSNADEFKQLKYWKGLVESKGIAIMEMGFPQEEARSFVIYDKTSPVIVLNTKDSIYSRIFSLFHEVGHLVFSHSSIDNEITLNESSSTDIETICNKIASNLLVNKNLLEDRLTAFQNTDIATTIFGLSQQFKVSREVIAYRLQEFGYYSQQEIENYVSSIKLASQQRRKKRGGGNYYKNVVINNSPLFLATAFENFNENRITFSKLVEYVKVKAEKIPNLEVTLMNYYD